MMPALKSLIVVLFLLIVGGTAAFLWMSSTDLKAIYVEPPKPAALLPSQQAALAPKVEVPKTAKPVSLTNKTGKTISAHLTSKSGGEVSFISDGREYTIAVATLNADSRQTIRQWRPSR